jgi:RNA polymerase sigma-70 factor (ECF subfamily)
VQAHQEAIFRLAYLLLGSAEEAEDVAQDAFVRAYRALHTFDQARPLRPWLLTLASNLAHNRLRSVKRYLTALRRTAREEPDLGYRFEDRAGRQWEAETLWEAVKRLKEQERQVIYLR